MQVRRFFLFDHQLSIEVERLVYFYAFLFSFFCLEVGLLDIAIRKTRANALTLKVIL